MNEKIGKNEYILLPERDRSTKTLMNDLSRGFSHYKEGAGIKKDISLSNLRKTYLTWHHQILGDDTGLVSSHSNTQVLEKYYIDPKVLTAIEISALKVRVFGKSEKT
jgi:integrase